MIKTKSDSLLSFLNRPRLKIYSLASSASRKFLLPESFPDFAKLFNGLFFAHSGKRERTFGYGLLKVLKEFFHFCLLGFHRLTPCYKITAKLQYCQIVLSIIVLLYATASLAATTLTYEYDANGNMIRGDGKHYEYNDANQLVKVRHGDQSGPVIAEYVYDHTGQRIKKIENGVTTYYIGKHFEKQVAGETQTNTSYYFANGERVAKKDPTGQVFYYHADHLGSASVITDSSGNLVERIKFYPFGEIRDGGNERYLYTGKEKDKLTDLYYYEARYYNAELKHFTQTDTIAPDLYDPQDLNKYAYVRNNPIKFIDPTGHEKIIILNKSSGALRAGHEAMVIERNGKYYYLKFRR